jgi:hypothetical protein
MLRLGTAQVDPVVSQALRARAFALRALSSGWDGHDSSPVRDQELFQSIDGWRLFLRVERCAHPLHQAVAKHGLQSWFPAPFLELLTHEANWELQHIRSARRQLSMIGTWAAEHGCRPIVLKGGLAALGESCVDLNDLDLLLPKGDAERLVVALLDQGYQQFGFAGVHHLRGIMREGELVIEIHVTLDIEWTATDGVLRNRIEEIPTSQGLWRLAPADHLWHVLTHGVVKHPDRRGRVRDLLLLQHAIAACAAEDIEATRQQAAKHQRSDSLRPRLDYGVQRSQGEATDDPFEELALIGYLLGHRKENRSRVHPTSGMVNDWVFAQLLGPAERRAIWSGVRGLSPDLSGFPPVRRLQLLSPRLGRTVQMVGRYLNRVRAYARAYPLAISIGRLLRHRRLPSANAPTRTMQ